jgi:hypothetical protein
MTTTYNWTIETCEHEISTGEITTAHWRVTAADGDYTATAYGSASFSPDPTSETFKPYDQITQDEVLAWVYAQIDKQATEDSLAAQIDLAKNPVSAGGTPWS